jgi:hypothetical protein
MTFPLARPAAIDHNYPMKATRSNKTPANLNIIRLVRGSDWTTLTTSKGQLTAYLKNSAGEEGSVGLDEARERMATLLGAGWTVAKAA